MRGGDPSYVPLTLAPVFSAGPGLLRALPRISRAGPAVSDLGSYNLFACTGANASRSCSFDMSAFSISALTAPPPNTLITYGEVRRRFLLRRSLSRPRPTYRGRNDAPRFHRGRR